MPPLCLEGTGCPRSRHDIKKIYSGVESLLYKYTVATVSRWSGYQQDLDRLEKLGVLEKINHSDWAAPVVPVPKANGSIRICGDYKVTVNPVLQVDQFPMPRSVCNGRNFSKLDLSHTYQHVLLEPESRAYLTINTHKGLYRYTRLPFGVTSAPAIIQQTMERVLQGLPGVVVYINDNIW